MQNTRLRIGMVAIGLGLTFCGFNLSSSQANAMTATTVTFNAGPNEPTTKRVASGDRQAFTNKMFVPSLCSDDEEFLRNLRDCIVNEKVLCGTNPLYLTSSEKKNPGGGSILVSTKANDEGIFITLSVQKPRQISGIAMPGSVTMSMSYGLKEDISRQRLLELVNELNISLRDKCFVTDDSFTVIRKFLFEDAISFDDLSYHINQGAFAVAFMFGIDFDNLAFKELKRDFLK
ncbi:hypothetical protein OAG62_02120 [bacterium]|nr:hypothetical protein [bacterium]